MLPWDQEGSTLFHEVIDNSDKYELQILYTQVHKDEGQTKFTSHTLNIDSTRYFYPASTVKMPVAFLALQRINELNHRGYKVNKNTPIRILKERALQTSVELDSSSADLKPSIEHYIKKIFAVSDNDAYCRLYEFLGRDYINNTLRKMKVFNDDSRIISRVGVQGFDYEENAFSNPVQLYQGDSILVDMPGYKSKGNFLSSLKNQKKGIAYISSGNRINESFDFSEKNFVSLVDLENAMRRIFYPSAFDANQRFKLNSEDYKFLKAVMSSYPREFEFPKYSETEYYDSYVKFFMYGDTKYRIPEQIKIYNKVGYAYGTLTDCAYIEDELNDIRFFLSATLLVNENGVFNDDIYEYETIGIPFLAELGRKVYEAELANKLKNKN